MINLKKIKLYSSNFLIFFSPRWKIFTNVFKSNPKVAATGPYLSVEQHPHIQSFLIALNRIGLEIMESTWRCPVLGEDKYEWIRNTEVVC